MRASLIFLLFIANSNCTIAQTSQKKVKKVTQGGVVISDIKISVTDTTEKPNKNAKIAGAAKSKTKQKTGFKNDVMTLTMHNDPVDPMQPQHFYFWDKLLIGFKSSPGDRVIDIEHPRTYAGEENITQRIEWYGHNVKLMVLDTGSSRKMGLISFLENNGERLIPFEQLEYKLTIDEKVFSEEWQSTQYITENQPGYKFLTLFDTYSYAIKPGTEAELRIRHSVSKELLRVVQLARRDLVPYQTYQVHLTQPTQNFERIIAKRDSIQQGIDSFYGNKVEWSAKATKQQEQQLTPSSRLLFFFRRQDKELADSILSFNIIANGKSLFKAPQTTGHMLLLDDLSADTHYEVSVWYTMQPENAGTYRFFLPPVWYKTPLAYGMAILLLFAVAGGFIYWHFKRKTKKAEQTARETNQRLASIRSQLNPHFVFNAMTSIQHLMNKNETDAANTFLSRFSKLLRTTLEPSKQGMIAVQEELNVLEQYLQLEQLRIPFEYEIEIKDMLDIHAVEIPAMLLQPLAENAIKHGLPHAAHPHIHIAIGANNNDFYIRIANNGKLFSNEASKGLGLQLVEEKLWIVNSTYPFAKATLDIAAKDENTIATIIFKNWLS